MRARQIIISLLAALMLLAGAVWAGETVDINSATAKQLQQVDGIGKKTAAKIVAYRNEHGPFKRVEDLLKTKGFGKKKLEKAGDELSVGKEAEEY